MTLASALYVRCRGAMAWGDGLVMTLVSCLAASVLALVDAGKTDRTLTIGTDVASFYVFHPDDLEHRRTSPIGWTSYAFACGPEFAAGNLAAFRTGGDGGFKLRVTDGDLTPRERRFVSAACEFRLKVRHGKILIDNGDHVPSDEKPPNPIPDDWWVAVPNGNYRVTVHAIDWTKEPGALDKEEQATVRALASYIIQFRPVSRLDAVRLVAPTPPLIEVGADPTERRTPADTDADAPFEEATSEPLQPSYLAVRVDGPVVPGSYRQLTVSKTLYDMLSADSEAGVVAVDTDKVPAVGVLTRFGGGGSTDDPDKWTLSLVGRRLVNVTKLTTGAPAWRATVTPLSRRGGKVTAKQVESLKAAFASYAKKHEAYRKAVRHPDFEAERVAAMKSPSALTNILLHHVQLPDAMRKDLLVRSDAERIRQLKSFLAQTR